MQLFSATVAFVGSLVLSASTFASDPASHEKWEAIKNQVASNHTTIPSAALNYAFNYLENHDDLVKNQDFLTILNFDLPSTAERMNVIDLKTAEVKTYLVAHGKNSGQLYATQFSNRPNSNMSSLGIYLADAPYIGSHGLSMKLKGMEASNNNAEARAIVLHAADYVSYDFINTYGRLGRSWGCPAVNPNFSEMLIKQLQGGSVFYIHRSPPVRIRRR